MVKKNDFDLIVTDLQMSGISGIEVLKEVKKLNPFRPVIILTGYGSVTSVTDAKRFGIDDFLIKPINNAELSARVSHCLEKYAMQNEIKGLKSKLAEYEKKLMDYENSS